jgi:glutathione S-transferase
MQIYAKCITNIVFELPPEDWGMPKFRERFPIGRVPILDVDGDMLPESEVIAEYLEEIYREPSLLGTTPRETAHIRMLARLGDIYIMNNIFMLARQTGALGRRTPTLARNDAVSEQLAGEVVQNLRRSTNSSAAMASPAAVASRWQIARSCLDCSLSRMSCRPSASARRFRRLQMSLPIGLQSRRTNTRQEY